MRASPQHAREARTHPSTGSTLAQRPPRAAAGVSRAVLIAHSHWMNRPWPAHLFTIADLAALDHRAASRAAASGELVRVKRGAYCARSEWDASSEARRHLLRVVAFAQSHPSAVFSHWSAAVVHGLPMIGRWPDDVHMAAARASGGRSETGVKRHCRGLDNHEWQTVDGMRVTTIARTLVDLAMVQPFRFALAPIDHALASDLSIGELTDYLDSRGTFRGLPQVARAMALADGRSGSPGESLSRGTIHELGFPAPLLQVEHRMPGRTAITDFEWPDYMTFGEFDGVGKYLRKEFLHGMTTADAVLAEKRREDQLRRATGFSAVRWGWDDALRVAPLRAILIEGGLPTRLSAPRAYAADWRGR